MSWSTIAASVAPWFRVIEHTVSAMVKSFFSIPALPGLHKHTTSKSEVMDHPMASTNEVASPADGKGIGEYNVGYVRKCGWDKFRIVWDNFNK
jgi:hypothetical protein